MDENWFHIDGQRKIEVGMDAWINRWLQMGEWFDEWFTTS